MQPKPVESNSANVAGRPAQAPVSKDGAMRQVSKPAAAARSSLELLLKIEAETRDADSEQELSFLIANETRKLVKARQIFVFTVGRHDQPRVNAVNSVDLVDRSSLMIRWVERLVMRLHDDAGLQDVREFALPAYCDEDDPELKVYPFRYFLWVPMIQRDGEAFAGVLMAREGPWSKPDIVVAKRLCGTYGHAWIALKGAQKINRPRLRPAVVVSSITIALCAISFIPVPLTVLAPAEVVPQKPFIVAAPIDGVVEEVVVKPNAEVKEGDVLVRFVDTKMRNRYELAEQEVSIARSKLKRFTQAAFDDPDAKRNLKIAASELRLKLAERDYAHELLKWRELRAASSGVAVFADQRDWAGRPVSLGERIMSIARPEEVELRVDLPVRDSIALQPGARVKLFLDSTPLKSDEAKITSVSHEARPARDGTLAFRVKAALPENQKDTFRLGARGTAQLYGDHTTLFFYLFRRPITALRQYLGW